MKVALDGTPLTVATGGVRRYTEQLTAALKEQFPSSDFQLVTDQSSDKRSWLARRWWAFGLPLELRQRKTDVFHGTDFSVPYWPVCASVMTVHDLSPWKVRAWQTGAARVRWRTPPLLHAGLVDLIVTPSEAVRREVIAKFRVREDRVRAIPLAAAPHFRPAVAFSWPRPYFLFVGTLEPRKNIPFLVDCWRAVRQQQAIDLLLCGRQRADFATLAPEPGLHVLGPQPDEQLPSLYSGAVAALYPSLYEGFGLPVLEAMQCGAAVLTSRDPAVREAGGEAAWALDADDHQAWKNAMEELLRRPALVQELRERGIRHAAQFSWQRTARETFAAYTEARQRFGR